MIRITALMDNNPSEHKALVAEHGLSFLVESSAFRMLFDCGSGAHPWANAHRLGLDVGHVDAVALSHSHYDHAAGYRDLIEGGCACKTLYTGPCFFEPKFAFNGVRWTDLSAGFTPAFLQENHINHIVVDGCREIFPHTYLVGDFPRIHPMETIPRRFVRQTADGFAADDFSDEICLTLDVKDKLYVLCGCSHPGILNMISRVHALFRKPVAAVYGGTHLMEADDERILATIEELRRDGLETLGLSHCSGERTDQLLKGTEGARGCHLGAGDCVFIEE